MRKGKEEKVRAWCEEHELLPLNIRSTMIKCGRKTIIVTLRCKQCGERYDRHWGNLQKQKFPWLCTKCAHKEIQKDRRLTVEKLIQMFGKYGYKVLTPIDKIKPVGKSHSYNHTVVTIQGADGVLLDICWNNFHNHIDYYLQAANGGYSAKGNRQSSPLEEMVERFLDDIAIPYKQEFKFSDCRGKKRMLPFDFCLYYDLNNKLLVEVDGPLHYKDVFPEFREYDRVKNGYCRYKNIPLLRIPYWEFESNQYKISLLHFINTNRSNDPI